MIHYGVDRNSREPLLVVSSLRVETKCFSHEGLVGAVSTGLMHPVLFRVAFLTPQASNIGSVSRPRLPLTPDSVCNHTVSVDTTNSSRFR